MATGTIEHEQSFKSSKKDFIQMKQQPYRLLAFTALILILVSPVAWHMSSTIDIQLHDAYYIINHTHILWMMASIAAIAWFTNVISTRLQMLKLLTWLHVVFTIATLLLLVCLMFWDNNAVIQSNEELASSNEELSFTQYRIRATAMAASVAILALTQLLLVINLVISICKKLLNSRLTK